MKRTMIMSILCMLFFSLHAQTEEQMHELGQKGISSYKQGDYQEALSCFKLIKQAYDNENQKDEDYASILDIITNCYSFLGDNQQAVEFSKQALNIRKSLLGEKHPDYARSLGVLANLYAILEDYSKAIEYGTKAMEIYKNSLGEDNHDYLRLLSNLAEYYSLLGNNAQAIEYGIKSMEICKIVLGESHPDYAKIMELLSIYYSNVADYSKAIDYGKKALEINKNLFGENHLDYAVLMENLASDYSELGNYSKAIEYVTKSLEIKRSIIGEKHPDYAKTLSDIALYYHLSGEDSEAIEYETIAVNIIKDNYGEMHPDYIINLDVLTMYYFTLGNYSKAIEFGTKALEIKKQSLGETHPDYVESLRVLAYYYSKNDNFSKAIEYGTKEKDIIKATRGEYNSDFATSLNNLSGYYFALSNYSKAVELGEQTLDILKVTLGENHPDYAKSLSNLSSYYAHLGDFSKAVEYEEQTLDILKVTLGENHPDYAKSLSNLTGYYSVLGDYSKALEYGEHALENRKSILGESHPDYAISLNNIATICSKIGDYSKALAYGEQALDILKSYFGKYHPDYASLLFNQASYYSHFGDNSKAEQLYNEVLEVFKVTLGEKHWKYANTLNNIATIYSKNGDYFKAVKLDEQALEIRKSALGRTHPNYAESLNNLASDYASLGDYSKAVELGEQALDILKTSLGENHPDYATSLSNLACYYSQLGNYSQSMVFGLRAVDIFKSINLRLFSSLSANQRSLNWTMYSSLFTDIYPSLFYKSNRHKAADIYDNAALFTKNLLLTTEIEINRLIQESGDQESLDMLEKLRSKRLLLQKLNETSISERLVNVDSIANEADKLEKTLISRSKVYGDFEQRFKTTWHDVQNVLKDDEIAVEFLSFNVYGTDSTMVAALTLRKDDKEPKFIPLFELEQLKGVCNTEHYLCPEVTNLVWEPLQKELKGIHRIYFSPAGVLHKIGIEYLPGIESYEMYRLSSTREIIDLKSEDQQKQNGDAFAALYGGIDYDKPTTNISLPHNQTDGITNQTSLQLSYSLHRTFVDSLDLRGQTVNYLPSTLNEVQNIQSSFNKIHHPVKVFIGSEASESSVKLLSGHAPDILHLATHGFYFTEHQASKKESPYFLTNSEQQNNNIEDRALARSGLFMAGANEVIKGNDVPMDSDDGILTAQEISNLDLRGLDLVVLSACETGSGDIMQGEGVFGLQRGFKKAGAQTILMSLWKVADIPTEMLMTEFYKNLCDGKSKRESLRLAQQIVREHKDSEGNYIFNDPHYWAGFVILD